MMMLLSSVGLALVVLMLLAMVRNEMVYRFRLRVIGLISDRNRAAIDDRRYDQMAAYPHERQGSTYNEMLCKFWEPLTVERWFPDLVEPSEKGSF